MNGIGNTRGPRFQRAKLSDAFALTAFAVFVVTLALAWWLS